jgi:hypothetical protein
LYNCFKQQLTQEIDGQQKLGLLASGSGRHPRCGCLCHQQQVVADTLCTLSKLTSLLRPLSRTPFHAPAAAGSYTLPLNRTPRQLADMEWDTMGRAQDIELSSNCLTATKSNSAGHSTVRGTILYADMGVHEFHVILDNLGPDGIWVGVAHPSMTATKCVGDMGCGWALHSDGDRRYDGREEEFTSESPCSCCPDSALMVQLWCVAHLVHPCLLARVAAVHCQHCSLLR